VRKVILILSAILGCTGTMLGQGPPPVATLAPAVRKFITVDAPVIALTHVKVIDGTGAPAQNDQTIVLDHGRIRDIGNAATTAAPEGAKVLNLNGYTVIPGLVGMHEHLSHWIPTPEDDSSQDSGWLPMQSELAFTGPRLYLALGVTSIRTAGTIEEYTELNLKRLIDEGKIPGPKMHLTSPRIGDGGEFRVQLHQVQGPEDAQRMVNYWADEGVTSFKGYMYITRAELAAAIEAAHKRGFKFTAHLCSVTYPEVIAMGIDNLEHGIFTDSQFVPGKTPDVCPGGGAMYASIAKLDIDSPPVQELIGSLVQHHVAITSTLAALEILIMQPNRPPIDPRLLDSLSPDAREGFLTQVARRATHPPTPQQKIMEEAVDNEMKFERAFVKAGGFMMFGGDAGNSIPGFNDQRALELLVEAGFTPIEAIHFATENGAKFLGESDRLGTLAPGKDADMVVIHGDPAARISDIEKVETVFKDGVGYDSAKLLESVRGKVGLE
jgi:imidazolonepropionase-like amidohydrolase